MPLSRVVLSSSFMTKASFHKIEWWSFHAFSVMTDFSNSHFLQASGCSLILVSSLLTVSLMYCLPQLQGTWYTTLEHKACGNLSFTLVSCALRVIPALKTTMKPNHLLLSEDIKEVRWKGALSFHPGIC